MFPLGVGHHEAAWLAEGTDPAGMHGLAHFAGLARIAEAAAFDAVFLADQLSLRDIVEFNPHEKLDPLVVLGALAASTERIGLVGTASTTFAEPYAVARQFASLDHVSGGRAGWNIVTTAEAEASENFGGPDGVTPRRPHEERYARAAEFVEVTRGLWDGWADDALVRDRGTGRYADPARITESRHRGAHFSVRGPLNVPRPPQGHPVLVQAGASEPGLEFAARVAELVFTAQYDHDESLAFTRDLQARAARHGRRPDEVLVLPGLIPVLGATEEEARHRESALHALGGGEHSLGLLSWLLGGVDLRKLPLDAPVPDAILPAEDEVGGQRARFALLVRLARRERLTLRQLLHQIAGGHGHRVIVGTPEQVAADIERWFRSGAADGFNVMPPVLPAGLEEFTEQVVPLLRRAGIFREGYAGTTLREHLGLLRPVRTGELVG
ncbi:LLM class flavin-dependent oxidoreductase [Pseudonocardia ailaonensis]|uniref:LLM class flavin-dependent oxidoreductase n=1 Tax=Pseudonocardia ailaonensis TaxID=367279 RepID=A0ABN2MIS5_9PSEU